MAAHTDYLKEQFNAWLSSSYRSLIEGMRLVAAYEYPDLTLEKLQAQLDALYREVAAAYIPSGDPHEKVKGLNEVFFEKRASGQIPIIFTLSKTAF